jgi:hypothetical protein
MANLFASIVAFTHVVTAFDVTLGFNTLMTIENQTIDGIHQAALPEGGVVTCWHGGDETNRQDALKSAFEERSPGMTLNITVDVSKYHDVNIDRQLVTRGVYVDSVILQTMHDYPRWADEGALLHYQPPGFNDIHPSFRDIHAAWRGVFSCAWTFIWNDDRTEGPASFSDFLLPAFKDKLVLTYPNDDDAVLYAFDLM